MSVELGPLITLNCSQARQDEIEKKSKDIIDAARDRGNYYGNWYKIEIIDNLYYDVINIYYEGTCVFQAREHWGDWQVDVYNVPDHLYAELCR